MSAKKKTKFVKRISQKLNKSSRHNKAFAIVAALSIVVVGYFVLSSRAATPFISFEGESATVGAPASIFTDSNSSGDAMLAFATESTSPPPTPTTGWPTVTTTGSVTYNVTSGDNTSALQSAMNTAVANNKTFVISGGIANVSGKIRIPNAPNGNRPHIKFSAGSGIRQTLTGSNGETQGVFAQWGSMNSTSWGITGGTAQFSSDIQFSSTSGMAVGDWIWIQSDDTYSHKNTQPGFLRKVVSINGGTVKIDKPLHRAIQTNRKATKVNLAMGAYVEGGIIEHAKPLESKYNLVQFVMVYDPRMNGTVIREGGASGIKNSVIYKGRFDLTIYEMKDDSSNIYGTESPYAHYGYGVEDCSSRETIYRLLEVYRVRHTYTTNIPGWYSGIDSRLVGYGEPEDVRVILLNAHDITSTGYNTHEPGWNISVEGKIDRPGRYRADGNGSGTQGGGGVFFRARRDHIRPRALADELGPGGLTITNAYDTAIEISEASKNKTTGAYTIGPSWSLDDAPIIQDVTVSSHFGNRLVSFYQRGKIGPNVRLIGPAPTGINSAESRSNAEGSAFVGSVRIEGDVTTPINTPTDFTGVEQYLTIIK